MRRASREPARGLEASPAGDPEAARRTATTASARRPQSGIVLARLPEAGRLEGEAWPEHRDHELRWHQDALLERQRGDGQPHADERDGIGQPTPARQQCDERHHDEERHDEDEDGRRGAPGRGDIADACGGRLARDTFELGAPSREGAALSLPRSEQRS